MASKTVNNVESGEAAAPEAKGETSAAARPGPRPVQVYPPGSERIRPAPSASDRLRAHPTGCERIRPAASTSDRLRAHPLSGRF
ncbi:unnamed protein product [Spodoptera exigua]|nr:unnamed protein product [Spodoptera exigua]